MSMITIMNTAGGRLLTQGASQMNSESNKAADNGADASRDSVEVGSGSTGAAQSGSAAGEHRKLMCNRICFAAGTIAGAATGLKLGLMSGAVSTVVGTLSGAVLGAIGGAVAVGYCASKLLPGGGHMAGFAKAAAVGALAVIGGAAGAIGGSVLGGLTGAVTAPVIGSVVGGMAGAVAGRIGAGVVNKLMDRSAMSDRKAA